MHLEAGAPLVVVSAPSAGADATFVMGVNDDHVRPQDPQGRVQRQLHHELLRADGQGPRRRVRRRAGPDDDDPRLHRRPAARRRPAQRPAPGPRRGHQHRADEHRRRPRHVARARVDEGQARRHVAAGPGARPARSPTSTPPEQEATVDEINAAFQGRQVAAAEGHPRVHRGPDRLQRHRRATRTRASSTPTSR